MLSGYRVRRRKCGSAASTLFRCIRASSIGQRRAARQERCCPFRRSSWNGGLPLLVLAVKSISMSTSKQDTLSDFLAAERTFLAWIRTGLALAGFGFVIARFGLFLREMGIGSDSSATAGGSPVLGAAIV